MKHKGIVITAILLVLALGNYFRISDSNIRVVDFFSILVIGAFFGVLIVQIFNVLREKEKENKE